MDTNRFNASSFFGQTVSRLFRLLIVVSVLGNALFIPSAGPAYASTSPGCSASGPTSGAYTVTLCFSAPAIGATLTGNQAVTATVAVSGSTPPTPGGKLFFYLDGQYILTDYQSPYTFTLSTARWTDGPRTLEVEAQMKDGFLTERASLSVTFNNGVTTPPINTNTRGPVSGTTPSAGQSFTVAVTGDGAGGESNETAVTNLIASWNPNMVLYVGDVYEQGTPTEFYNWYGSGPDFYSRFRSITNPAIGNHEYLSGGGAAGYFDYWDNIPHYYSYNVAGWHIISIDSTGEFGQTSISSQQYLWLANDLSNNTAACTLAYWHHPAFSIAPSDQAGDTTRVQNLWKLLANHGVDLLLAGHDHDYQRWTAMDANGIPDPNGTTEFVVGTGGHAIQGFIRSDTRMLKGFDTSPNSYGAMRLELNASGAAFQFVNKDGSVLDSGSVPCTGAQTDTSAPSNPTNLVASSSSAARVDLTWTASTDDVGVVGYDIYRNGSLLASTGPQTSYSDLNVSVASSYSYEVRARDAAGHVSGASNPSTVTTPTAVFADGFESGNFTNWDSGSTLTIQQSDVFNGAWAAQATSATASDPAKFAKKTLNPTMTDVYYRAWFKMVSHGANSVDILRFRTAANAAILSVFTSSNDKLSYRNDVTGVSVSDAAATVSQGNWHSLQAHLSINGTSSTFEVWLDGVKNTTLSTTTANLGTTAVGIVQLGEPQSSRVYDVLFDDAAVNSQFIPTADSPPAAPANFRVTANTSGHVDLAWNLGTDSDLAGYELYRGGVVLASLGVVTSYSDTDVAPSTSYQYQLRARDASGNLSSPSSALSVTTPADSIAPTVTLTGPSAGATLRGSVTLSASASDNVAIGHVDFLVNGTVVGDSDEEPYSLTWDSTTIPDGLATIAARAVDAAGNSTTTPTITVSIDNAVAGAIVLSDGFESGALSPTWTNQGSGLIVQSQQVLEGSYTTRATSTAGTANWAYATLSPSRTNLYYRIWFNLLSQGASNVSLLRFRTAQNAAVLGVFVSSTGKLGITNDTPGGTSTTSTTSVSRGAWHELQAHVSIDTANGSNGLVDVWLDGIQVAALSKTENLGTTAIARLQLGESQTSRTYDVLFDEIVARLSLVDSPTTPFTIINSGPSGTTTSSSASFDFSSNAAGASFACNLDGAGFSTCTSPQGYTGLADGVHTFQVRATDTNNVTDATPASRTWTVDSTPPSVSSVNPADGANGVDVTATISAVFSEDINAATLTGSTFTLVDQATQTPIPAAVSYNAASKTATLDPTSDLPGNVTYVATIKGSAGGVTDSAGNPLVNDYIWSFYTGLADTSPPTAPSGLTATAISSGQIDLSWTAATDDVAVTAYDVYRDSTLLASTGNVTNYSDFTAAPATAYTYQVRARDAVGNASTLSNQSSATTPAALFVDRFETGSLSQWTTVNLLAMQQQEVFAGVYAVRSNSSSGPASFAAKNLGSSLSDAYFRTQFKIISHGANSVHLMRFRTAAGASILQPFVSSTNKLGYRNNFTNIQTTSTTSVSLGAWHDFQVHVHMDTSTGTNGQVEVWLDGVKISDLSKVEDLGTIPVGGVLLGEDATGLSFDTAYDDVTVANAFINSGDMQPPDAPTGLLATPVSETRIDLVWNASTDNIGVTGYNIFRDGSLLASVSNTSYSDTTGSLNTPYTYTVRASDAAENISTASDPVTVSTLGDTTLPSVNLTSPADGATVSGTITLTADATDNIAVDHVDFLANDVLIASDTTSPYSTSWNSASVADGSVTITAQAFDGAANAASSSHTVTVDNTVPDTTIDSGPSGYATSTEATFTFSSNELGVTFECSLDFTAFTSCTSPVSYTNLVDGIHDLQVRAKDATGNVDTTPASRSWTIDTVLPRVRNSSGTLPADGSVDQSITTSVSATFTEDMDASTLTAATFTLVKQGSTTPIQATVTYDSLTRTVTLTPASNLDYLTTYTATVKGGIGGAADLAGNTMAADKVWTFTTMTDPTPPTVTLTAPANGGTYRSSVTLAADAADNVAVDHVDFLVNGTIVGTATAAPYTINWNSGTVADGSVAVSARAVDIYSNATTSSSVTITLDNTAPTVTSVTPLTGATGVSISTSVSAVFSEAMDAATLTTGTVTLVRQQGNVSIAASVSYNAATKTVTLVPATNLESSTNYTATIRGGAGGVTDLIGNPLAVDRVWSFTTQADTVPPETTISSGPASFTNATTATLNFSSNEANSTFDCSLDGATFRNCTSPKSYNRLADGAHSFQVRAIDAAGNVDSTPASWSWTVDTVAPTVSSVSPAGGATNVPVTSAASAVFSEAMDGTTINASTFTLVRQGTTTPISATISYSSITKTANLVPAANLLANTTYTATVKSGTGGVKDLAGNPLASDRIWSFTTAGLDTTPPDTTITSGPSATTNSTSASFSFTSTESGSTFSCSLDGAAFSACTSPVGYSSLANGSHTFQVRATDAAGNTDVTPASQTWTIDTVAPDTTITAGPSGASNSTSASFTFASTEAGSSFACSLDGAAFSTCTSPKAYSNLTSGFHTFQVRATDAVGNTDATPASRSWTVDLTAPTVSISSPANGSTVTGNVTIAASASDNLGVAQVSFYVDGALLTTDTSSPYNTNWNTNKVTKTTHTIYAIAVDSAGNATQSATITVTVR